MLKPEPTATFVVRLRAEPVDHGGYRWLGRVEHVQSGQHEAFARLADLLSVLERFLVRLEQSDRKTME